MGYLPSVAELKSGANFFSHGLPVVKAGLLEAPKHGLIEEKNIQKLVKAEGYELPHMPPWFGYVGSVKLYQSLAGILRLVGLSLVAGDFKFSFSFGSQTVHMYNRYLHSLLITSVCYH